MVVGMAEIGQRCDEPLHEKKEGRSSHDTLAEPGLGGITHCRWNCLTLMDKTSPEIAGR
jgi:hypothetical protein